MVTFSLRHEISLVLCIPLHVFVTVALLPCLTHFSKPKLLQAPGMLTAEIATPGPRLISPGATRAGVPSSSTLSAPSARRGDSPAGQLLSRLCGLVTEITMVWSTFLVSVVLMEIPVMQVISGTDGTGEVTRMLRCMLGRSERTAYQPSSSPVK